MTLSSSPGRNTFQKEKYLERCEAEDKPPSEDYLRMFDSIAEKRAEIEESEEFRCNNLEYDLRSTSWILDKVRASDVYAQNLYAAICNNEFQKIDVFPILADQRCSYSWRYAGGIIADMQMKGDYIDWYCSGIRGERISEEDLAKLTPEEQEFQAELNKYVPESHVTEEIQEDLARLGWKVLDQEDE
jgi:hypothetical protein